MHASGTSTANTIRPTEKVTEESRSSTSAAVPVMTASHKSACRRLNCARYAPQAMDSTTVATASNSPATTPMPAWAKLPSPAARANSP